ncbi:hypothetical protein Ancab_024392 [Ancistrocladus abbreviatus]
MASPLCSLLFFLATTASIAVTPTFSISNNFYNHKGIETGFRVTLKRVDSDKNLTTIEHVKRQMERGEQRARSITTTYFGVGGAPVHPAGGGAFVMELAIGTPPITYSLDMDTGSDLIWTQCSPCQECFNQPDQIFNPQRSYTYSRLSCYSKPCQSLRSFCSYGGCAYSYRYTDQSETHGYLGIDTFTFGSEQINNLVFGCGYINRGTFGYSELSGICGLGNSPISLVQQLAVKKFAYCLTAPVSSSSSTLLMGSHVNNLRIPITKVTPMTVNPKAPVFYYISCTGISVDGQLLNIAPAVFSLKKDGTGGMVVDSGTTFTQLPEDVFYYFADVLIEVMNLPYFSNEVFELCFQLPQYNIKLPEIVFHFENMDLEMSDSNIWANIGGAICLAMGPTKGLAFWGNWQQANWLIVYDVPNRAFGFTRANCAGF